MYLQPHGVEFDLWIGSRSDPVMRITAESESGVRLTGRNHIAQCGHVEHRLHQLCLQLGPSLTTNSSSIRYDGRIQGEDGLYG
jgi:hypothetical protein